MRKIFTIAMTLAMLLTSSCIYSNVPVYENDFIVKVGDQAPDFEIELIDGQKVRLSDLKGRIVMLQFTASWCGVCRREMPEIEKQIWQPHKDDAGFVLIGIDRDEPLETVRKFMQQTKVTYPLGLDPDALIFSKYALKDAGITRNILIDENGKIVRVTRSFKEDEFKALADDITARLKELSGK